MIKNLEKLEDIIEYKFKDKSLIELALTHKSFAYENTSDIKKIYNERIEFLGDAILEHVISSMLYKDPSNLSEGKMSKMRAEMVCEVSLSSAMKRYKLENYIKLGKGEIKTDGRHKDAIIADAFESIVGAIYLDAGYEEAKRFIFKILDKEIYEVMNGKNVNEDYKTNLQEELQKNGTVKIEYNLLDESGPDHDKTFNVEVLLNGKKIGEGYGKNKKQAEQNAAKNALSEKRWNRN